MTGVTSNSTWIAKIYRNDNGNFTDINAPLTGVMRSSVAWGDYDNDGDLDILLTGDSSIGSPISKIYKNNNGNFTEIATSLIGVASSSVAWGDYDNDGDLDILLTGDTISFTTSNPVSKIYRNDNGVFIDIAAPLTNVLGGSVAFGDYDNDGDLDILLAGATDSSSVTKIYRNQGGIFNDIGASLQGIVLGSVVWGDYDNDGDLDILLAGSSVTKIYSNQGGNFNDIGTPLQGVYAGSATWGDYDNDNDLDILLTSWPSSNVNVSEIYKNNTVNLNMSPTAPTNLNASVNGSSVTLSWFKSTDSKTPQSGLTYNLRIGTTSGSSNILSPMSTSSGYRKITQFGNVNQANQWTVKNLASGTYYWSLQAIDTTFTGSAFATEGSFTILPTVGVPTDPGVPAPPSLPPG